MKLKIAFLAVAGLLAAGAQAAVVNNGTVSADIVASGNFNNVGAEGALGLAYMGKEWIQWGTHSSWTWLTTDAGSWNTYGNANPLGTFVLGAGPNFVVNGKFGSLTFVETTTLPTANQLAVQVQFTNNSGRDITGVYWGVGLDPDVDRAVGGGFATDNRILGQGQNAAVAASGVAAGQTLVLANTTSAAAYQIAAYINHGDCCSPVNPATAVGAAQAVGTNFYADDSISLGYQIGTIKAGQTVSLGYSYTFAPVPEPETYAMFLAGLGLMGAVARRRSRA